VSIPLLTASATSTATNVTGGVAAHQNSGGVATTHLLSGPYFGAQLPTAEGYQKMFNASPIAHAAK
jgi:hypothetical protein